MAASANLYAVHHQALQFGGIKVFPNPANIGTQVTIVCNYPANVLQGAVLRSDLTERWFSN